MKVALPVVLLLGAASAAHADRRSFTRTYEYMTMPEGETELEIYTTQSREVLDGASAKEFELQLEIEHGITNRWDVSLYHVFTQVDGATPDQDEPFGFRELKLRTRYRFSERGELPVDILLYGEGVKVFGEQIYEAEGKLILARDFDKLTLAVNAIGEAELGAALEHPEYFVGWAAGATYEALPEIKLGAESWGDYALDDHEGEEPLTGYAGPSVSWAPATSLWATVGAGFGITDNADDLTVRAILGLSL
jgi:hypothetical protein